LYRLDFFEGSSWKDSKKEKKVYIQLFEDAGWEYISEMGGWQYFRKHITPGEQAEIFTDSASKIQKYKRYETSLATMVAILLPLFVASTSNDNQEMIRFLVFTFFFMYLGFAAVCLVKINRRIKDLNTLSQK
jgi:hypothetical protein